MINQLYKYDQKLSPQDVLVLLIDEKNYYSELERNITEFSKKYGFTFSTKISDLSNNYIIKHTIIVDGLNKVNETVKKHKAIIDASNTVTLAISYSSAHSCRKAVSEIDALKAISTNNINFLRPTEGKDGFFKPTLQKLVDNSVCDSIRIKYEPVKINTGKYKLPSDVKDFFIDVSKTIKDKKLYHRACTDGFISIRDPNDKNSFFITCTKTSKTELDLSRICKISSYNEDKNMIYYHGNFLPSSDCVEAAIVYSKLPKISAIVHTHASHLITRNPMFANKIAVPPLPYGEPSLGHKISEYIEKNDVEDFLILEDHGEFFIFNEKPTKKCAKLLEYQVCSVIGKMQL